MSSPHPSRKNRSLKDEKEERNISTNGAARAPHLLRKQQEPSERRKAIKVKNWRIRELANVGGAVSPPHPSRKKSLS